MNYADVYNNLFEKFYDLVLKYTNLNMKFKTVLKNYMAIKTNNNSMDILYFNDFDNDFDNEDDNEDSNETIMEDSILTKSNLNDTSDIIFDSQINNNKQFNEAKFKFNEYGRK